MKKVLLTSALCMGVIASANALDFNPYVSLKLGYGGFDAEVKNKGEPKQSWDVINGFTGAIAGGAAFDVHQMVGLRGELEYSFSQFKGKEDKEATDDMKINDHMFLLGAYADFGGNQWAGFNPYIGLHAGYVLGTAVDALDEPTASINMNGLVYGFSVGTAYSINDNIAIDLGVRYLITDRSFDMTHDGDKIQGDFSINQWSVLLGARYTF